MRPILRRLGVISEPTQYTSDRYKKQYDPESSKSGDGNITSKLFGRKGASRTDRSRLSFQRLGDDPQSFGSGTFGPDSAGAHTTKAARVDTSPDESVEQSPHVPQDGILAMTTWNIEEGPRKN